MNLALIQVWKINNHVIVARTIEDAIAIYKKYMETERIEEIKLINSDALYMKEEHE